MLQQTRARGNSKGNLGDLDLQVAGPAGPYVDPAGHAHPTLTGSANN